MYGKYDLAIYDLQGNRYSTEGFTMPECRVHLLNWINRNQRDSWASYCMKHWLNALGGLGATW